MHGGNPWAKRFRLGVCRKPQPFRVVVAPLQPVFRPLQSTIHPDFSQGRSLLRSSEASYSLYLIPTGCLKVWFFLFSALAFVVSWITSGVVCGVFVVLTNTLAYWLIYHVLNTPVLINAWSGWPKKLDTWFLGLPGKISLTRKDKKIAHQGGDDYLFRLELVINSQRLSMLNYRFRGFRQIASHRPRYGHRDQLLRAAMNDRFKGQFDDNGKPGLRTWMIYWFAPVWTGYILFYIPPIMSVLQNQSVTAYQAKWLAIGMIVWTASSLIFLWRQIRYIDRQRWKLTDHELSFWPSQLYDGLSRYSNNPYHLKSLQFQGFAILVQVLSAGTFLVFLQILVIN